MQDLYPLATWIGSPNFEVGRQGQKILAIVGHIMEGTLAGSDSWFQVTAPGKNPQNAVSAHFGAGKDGTIHQYVRLSNTAWANGVVEAGNTMPASWPKVDPNYFCVSIEAEGNPGDIMPEAQFQGIKKLIQWIQVQATLLVTSDSFLGHYRISPRSRARCPDGGYPWTRFMSELSTGLVINWPQKKIFVDWCTGRFNKQEIWWGPDGLAAFQVMLKAIGCDPGSPGLYGWPL